MKRFFCMLLIALFIVIMASCAKAALQEIIRPQPGATFSGPIQISGEHASSGILTFIISAVGVKDKMPVVLIKTERGTEEPEGNQAGGKQGKRDTFDGKTTKVFEDYHWCELYPCNVGMLQSCHASMYFCNQKADSLDFCGPYLGTISCFFIHQERLEHSCLPANLSRKSEFCRSPQAEGVQSLSDHYSFVREGGRWNMLIRGWQNRAARLLALQSPNLQ